MTLDQGQEMTLTFNTHLPSFIQLVIYTYQFSGHSCYTFWKILRFHFFL